MVIKSRMLWMLAGLLSLGLFTLPCLGAQAEPGAVQAPDAKVTEAAAQITPVLDAFLTQANESKVPAQKEISTAQTVLDSTKRYFAKMDNKQKAQYCLLQSWQAYYSGQLENAHVNAVKAWKLDATSGDIWATQVAMAILADKKPMLPRPEKKPARAQRNRQPGGGMEGTDIMVGNPQDPAGQIQPGKLSFDITQFRAEAIDKKLEPLELSCLNGTTFGYKPGGEALCVLFWQKFETKKAGVSREPNQPGAAAPQAMSMPPMMDMGGLEGGMMMGTANEGTATGAFGNLFRTGLAGGGRVKFLAVNLDSAAQKKAVVEEMFKQPQVWAQVLVADQTAKSFSEFGAVSPEKPVLMMADSNGSIRYAGSATGFIAPMLLNKFLKGDLKEPAVPAEINPVVDSNSVPVADSNSLSKPAPVVKAPAPKAARPQVKPKELSEEDKVQAETKVGVARDLYMKLGKKPGLNYREGVKLCREVMRKYPGSEYADQARELMRQVPDNERAQYGITDEELGL
jgi:hypothetical protein